MIEMNDLLHYASTLNILYVEDDNNVREQTAELLEDFFAEVIVAKNGKKGWETYQEYYSSKEKDIDMVITDIRMPELDGIEMSKKILALNPMQIIIVLSAHNETEHLLEVINMGINYFLLKPLRTKQLYQTLHKAAKKLYYDKMLSTYTQKIENLNTSLEIKMKELEKLAREDPLTGISNRRHFFEKANVFFSKENASSFPLYFFVVDIDKFKNINDTFGHAIGDEVIKKLVSSVQKELNENDCFSRFGGDEFVVILSQKDEASALSTIKRIKEHVTKPEMLQGIKVDFDVSIGMAEAKSYDDDIDIVIKEADKNLYEEKYRK